MDRFHVTSAIVAAGNAVAPVLLAGRCREGRLEIALTKFVPTRSDRDKSRVAQLMQSLVERPQFDFVAHVTEAWVLIGQGIPEGSIANHPQRTEAVLFNILSKDCQTLVINPLHRNPSRLERGGQVDFSMSLQGRFVRPPPARN